MSYAKLYFGKGNAKLDKLKEKYNKEVYTFSTMSGYTCPYAKECHSKAVFNGESWKIQDSEYTQFRCFSASQEVIYRNVREQRIQNMYLVEVAARDGVSAATELIQKNLPNGDNYIVRVNVGGDMPTQNYFDAWIEVAKNNPNKIFYAYTKSLPFWVKRLGQIPSNFVLTASYGGHRDDLIEKYNLRYAKVVYSESEAFELGLQIDHDDSLAISGGDSFALLIHGIQPKGSEAGKALRELNGVGSYGK